MKDHIHIQKVTSTNQVLAEQIQSVEMDGFIIQTDYQTAGKGQAGNYWESEDGKNLLFSLALFPDFLEPSRQFLLSKAISIGIVEALDHITPGFQIKWPNDIYYKNRKIAGILIETAIMGNGLKHAIVGVGLNVNQTEFKDAPLATSLKLITGQAYQLNSLIDTIRGSILKYYHYLKDGDFALINQTYCAHLFRKQGYWPYRTKDETFEATIQHVRENGLLVLKRSDGNETEYWMKEVEFVL